MKYLPEALANDQNPVISYRAIARALASTQHKKYGVEESPNRYKDRVRRAVLGQRLTFETLDLFAETFDFAPEVIEQIGKYIGEDGVERDSTKVENRNHFITPTSTVYDIYLDKDHAAYKIDSTIIVRAVTERVEAIWAMSSEDIKEIELLEGGTSAWDPDRNAWKFTLDHPLSTHESALLRYITHINTDVEQIGLISLNYRTTRQACFFRLFFDDAETAPESLVFTREFASANASPYNVDRKTYDVPVVDGRASFYLDNVYKERLIFSAQEIS